MEALFASEYRYLWMALLAAALFFPARQIIWVLSVRRAIGKAGEEEIDAAEKQRLKKRANVTSALLCSLFSQFYFSVLFKT